jgi:hypothetical protein
MQKSKTTPDEFLSALPDDVRADMTTLDEEISKVMAGRDRVLWEGRFWGGSDQRIIGYGGYSYRDSKGKEAEWFVVGLAAQKNYLTVFVNAVEDGTYVAEGFKDRLGKVKVGRSSVSFKRLEDVNLPALVELVARTRDASPVGT